LIEQEKFFNKRVASKNLIGYTIVRPGSLVYNKSYSANAPLGVITRNVHEYIGVVSPLYIVFKANEEKVLPRFLELATNSAMFHDSLKQFVKEGGRAHGGISVSLGDFFGSELLIPTLTVQKRIVDLVSSFDEYIDALQHQAASARKARNAVLHELLSAGGDDWTESTLGELCDVRDGTHDSPKQSENGYPLVTSKNIRNGKVDMSDSYLISDSDFHEINKRSKVDKFDLLISMIGTVGEVCFEPNQPNYAIKNVGLIKTGSELLGKFLLGYLSSGIGQEQIELSTSGSTQKFIGLGKLRSLKISLPPLVEQKRIVEIVSCIDEVIQSTEQAVVEAKALRSGLLSDLLSGNHEIPESYDRFLRAA
jgi:type I restriction enzyme S subunit